MSDPVIARKAPCAVDLKAGEKYFFCACKAIKTTPFCDGSHHDL